MKAVDSENGNTWSEDKVLMRRTMGFICYEMAKLEIKSCCERYQSKSSVLTSKYFNSNCFLIAEPVVETQEGF